MFKFIPSVLNNIKVGWQVTIVTAMSLVALSALAYASYFEADTVARTNHVTTHAAHKANIFSKIYSDGLQMRRNEKDYLALLLPKYIEKYDAAVDRALEDAHIFQSIADNDEELKRVEHIIGGLKLSQQQFHKVVNMKEKLGIKSDLGQIGQLRAAVHEVEDVLKKVQSGANKNPTLDILTVEMLMLRRHEKDFMLRKDEKYLKKFSDTMATFNKKLSASKLNLSQKKDIKAMMGNYDKLFSAWAQLELQTIAEVKQLSTIYATIEPEIIAYFAEFDEVSRLSVVNSEAIEIAHDKEMLIIYGTVCAVILFIALCSLFVSRNISAKIRNLSLMMDKLAEGDTEANISYTHFKNEFGVMARSLLIFKDTAIDNVKRETIKQTRLAKEAKKADEMRRVIQEFKGFSSQKLQNVNKASENLEKVSISLMHSAGEIKSQSAIVKNNVGNTSMNVTGVAAATEEMSIAVSEIAAQAAGSATIVEQAKGKTSETVMKLSALTDSAKKIETVVKLIDEIAEQTNLLALNATIEAARAGDAGRGFAVVANEVKSLADQTGKATGEIAAQISQIQQDGELAAKTVSEMDEIIANLSEASMGVAAAVEEQSAAIGEISSNVTKASDLSQESAASMDVASESVDTVNAISGDVMQVANQMKSEVEALESDINLFLRKINEA